MRAGRGGRADLRYAETCAWRLSAAAPLPWQAFESQADIGNAAAVVGSDKSMAECSIIELEDGSQGLMSSRNGGVKPCLNPFKIPSMGPASLTFTSTISLRSCSAG